MSNIKVVECSDGTLAVIYQGLVDVTKTIPAGEVTALRDYFQCKPEPKPWMDAAPGEVWMLTFGGVSGPHLVNHDPRFVDGMGDAYGLNDHRITEGYRIWPVDEEGDDRE